MTSDDLLDPLIGPGMKGFPHDAPAVRRSAIAARGWSVLAGDLPLPSAVLKRAAVDHNVAWLQGLARRWGIDLAPHGKTTMSPQLFRRQLDAGAWGLTFATVAQMRAGVAGNSTCVSPNSRSPSTIALAIAPSAGVMPPSPPPRRPRGCVVDGTSLMAV